jgi:xanthine dehydrogenase YagR molybdenum-binding subunit
MQDQQARPKFRPDNRVALENDAVRFDVVEKVTGKARYTTDYYLPNMLWAAYIRSPFGASKVAGANEDAAKAVKGVLEVELRRNAQGRYHGDRLGHIVAESRQALSDALAALDAKWEVAAKPRTRIEEERTPADKLDKPKNQAEADAALGRGEVVAEATYQTQVQTHCSLEPHGVTVDFKGDRAVAYGSTQGTFSVRDDLARELGLRQDQVEFHCEYVGGGFGSKFGAGAEGQLAARISKKYGRPCRCICNRKEEQLDTGNRPGSLQYMKIAAARDGKLLGGVVNTWGSVGPTGGGPASGGGGGGGGVRNPGRYAFGAVAKTHEDVSLNGGFPRSMRAPGFPQAQFAIELMMDLLAAKAGIDPVEFRVLNDPNETRKQMYRAGAELIGWNRRKPDGQWPGVVKKGFGIGAGEWGNGRGRGSVGVNVYRSGTVEVLSGAQDIGQGFRTLIGDIVGHQLGLPRELITVKVGQSTLPPGPGSGGSVTSRTLAPRAFLAADKARDALFKVVAKEWNVDEKALKLADGKISAGDKTIDWQKACSLIPDDRLSVQADTDEEYWKQPTGSEAVHFVEADVDTETGIVSVKKVVALQDVGLPVNRNTIENQICGAVIQGVSFTLFEDRILNRQTGAMVNANMEMYKIAGPKDVPEIVPVIWKSREDANLGVNSLGEPPSVPICGAIACAVANAIGAQVTEMPLYPRRVLAALAGKAAAAKPNGGAQ